MHFNDHWRINSPEEGGPAMLATASREGMLKVNSLAPLHLTSWAEGVRVDVYHGVLDVGG